MKRLRTRKTAKQMNRATVLLKNVPTEQRCEEIARKISLERFGQDYLPWTVMYRIPEDMPVYLRDQFEAEIRESKLTRPAFIVVYGPTSAADGEK